MSWAVLFAFGSAFFIGAIVAGMLIAGAGDRQSFDMMSHLQRSVAIRWFWIARMNAAVAVLALGGFTVQSVRYEELQEELQNQPSNFALMGASLAECREEAGQLRADKAHLTEDVSSLRLEAWLNEQGARKAAQPVYVLFDGILCAAHCFGESLNYAPGPEIIGPPLRLWQSQSDCTCDD